MEVGHGGGQKKGDKWKRHERRLGKLEFNGQVRGNKGPH